MKSVAVSPDGKYIVAVGSKTWLWDRSSLGPKQIIGDGHSLIFSHDSKFLISAPGHQL
jgi:hypothetical protein